MWIPPHLRSAGTVVLDGGMSNALADRGHDLSGRLWTARLLRDAPDEIAAVHASYFRAGARVATTASYQASEPTLVDAGLDRTEARRLVRRSVTLAREVRDRCEAEDGSRRWVAASVGPYGATLADGSEYRGRYGVSRTQLRDFHLSRLELLASAEPDLLAVETIPDLDEVEVLVEVLDQVDLPAWLSCSVVSEAGVGTADRLRTRAGQPLADAFRAAAGSRNVFAVGVNCCDPGDVRAAIELAARTTGLPGVAYPNSGEGWDATARDWVGRSCYDVRLAPDWVAAGAAYVGGCCRVGPEAIADLAAALQTQQCGA